MNKYYNKNNSKFKSLLESLVFNKYFYIVFNILFLLIGNITKDYLRVFFTAYFLIFFSYFIHVWSHDIPIFKKLHLIHHTKIINKYVSAELLEFLLNLLIIGGGIFIPINLYIGSKASPLSNYAILFYTLIYTFQHVVIYHYIKVPTHVTHHKVDKKCLGDMCKNTENILNYGPDAMDALFGTKKNLENYEDMSPLIPLLIVLIILILFNFNNKYDIIKWLES